jgi:hypothetical protein
MGVGRFVEVVSRARREGCRLSGGYVSGMIVHKIVEVGSRARRTCC